MTAPIAVPTREEAAAVLELARDEVLAMIDALPRRAVTLHGLGGGEWSPKDLLGHLASWEEYGLDALAAWERGEPAPIDALWRTVSTTQVNRQNVEAKAAWSFARVRRDAERSHAEMLAAIRGMTEERWLGPVTSRGRKPLATRLGGILSGTGPFRHDDSHLPSLRAFAAEHAPSRPR